MITIKPTENFAGVTITGDFNDLDALVEAFYAITIDEDDVKHKTYFNISTRLLGMCYDIRHACQGDRGVVLQANGMDNDKIKYHKIIAPLNNVLYECNSLFPEMVFTLLTINKLVEIRAKSLSKNKYFELSDNAVLWNKDIAILRFFQAAFVDCVKNILSPNMFSRWINLVSSKSNYIEWIATQYLDVVNIDFLELDKEKRLKNINIFTKRITEFEHDSEYKEIKNILNESKAIYGHENVRFLGDDYPEIIW